VIWWLGRQWPGAGEQLACHRTMNISKQLQDAGVHELQIGGIWPQFEVDPEKLGMKGWSGEGIDFLTEQLKKTGPNAGAG